METNNTPEQEKLIDNSDINQEIVYKKYFLQSHHGLHEKWERDTAAEISLDLRVARGYLLDRVNKYKDDYTRMVDACTNVRSELEDRTREVEILHQEAETSRVERNRLEDKVTELTQQVERLKAENTELAESGRSLLGVIGFGFAQRQMFAEEYLLLQSAILKSRAEGKTPQP